MAPSSRSARSGRAPASAQLKKKAAAGFAKRQAKKAKGPALDDVYEFQQQKERRGRTTVDTRLGREEVAEFGFGRGDDSDEDEERRELRARLIGENEENEGLGSDEDEEIDSDAAFEEEDEDRYAGFNFPSAKKSAKSSKKASSSRSQPLGSVRFADVDLDEDVADDPSLDADEVHVSALNEDDEDEEEEEGMVDLLDILDGKAQPYFASDSDDGAEVERAVQVPKAEPTSNMSSQEGSSMPEDASDGATSDSEEEGESDGDALMIAASDEESEVAEGALDTLTHFISGLDASSKRKADEVDEPTAVARPPKRRAIKEVSEAMPENEFSARMPTGSQKLNLDDFLAPLSSRPSELQALKKSTRVLSSSKAGTLSAPLPTRAQERLDREAAYEQTKEEVDKWSATMKRIKEAEHLSFPLQQERPSQTSNLELNAKFKPTTELETAVDRLLKTARLREEDMKQTEELKMNHLTPEEVQARRAELRKMRDLMFRAEAKAKRVAKIKSKSYRRIKKKERAKLAEKLGDVGEDDPNDEEVRLRREVERAKERATLRHKNTGKWAKAMRARGELDEEQRQDLNDMLDRGEKLRRRIQGIGSDEDERDSDDTDSDADVEALKASAFDELRALRDEEAPDTADSASKKSVFHMKFMKDTMQRDLHRVNASIDDFVNEMGGTLGSDGEDASEFPASYSDAVVQRVNGRVSYHPAQATNDVGLRPLGSMESSSSSVTLKSTDVAQVTPPLDATEPLRVTPPPADAPALKSSINPWLQSHDYASSSRAVKRNEIVVSKQSAAQEKSKHKFRKQAMKRDEEKAKAQADAELEISVDDVLVHAPSASTSASGSAKRKKEVSANHTSQPRADSDEDVNSEAEAQEQLLQRKGKKAGAFQQRDLVAAAFAGDNVVKDFAQAKQREIQEDAPREVDTSLPGWGSWGGRGTTKKQAPKPHLIKRVAGIDPKSRTDYGKSHVIISEKRDKKASKYLVNDLPYPYTSKAQFERSLSTPLGTEWNTHVGFQRGTLPKVVKKMGTIINPLEKLA